MSRKKDAAKDRLDYSGEIILRDQLALERTRLANERTLLSYIRTSLYLIVGGIALMRVENLSHLQWLGIVCFVLSAIAIAIGLYHYIDLRLLLNRCHDMSSISKIRSGSEEPRPPSDS